MPVSCYITVKSCILLIITVTHRWLGLSQTKWSTETEFLAHFLVSCLILNTHALHKHLHRNYNADTLYNIKSVRDKLSKNNHHQNRFSNCFPHLPWCDEPENGIQVFTKTSHIYRVCMPFWDTWKRIGETIDTRNRKHRRAAAKPAACAPNAVNTREQGKEGGRVR